MKPNSQKQQTERTGIRIQFLFHQLPPAMAFLIDENFPQRGCME
jgi:hypothetical protein